MLRQVQRETTQTGKKGTYLDRYKGDLLRQVQRGPTQTGEKGPIQKYTVGPTHVERGVGTVSYMHLGTYSEYTGTYSRQYRKVSQSCK